MITKMKKLIIVVIVIIKVVIIMKITIIIWHILKAYLKTWNVEIHQKKIWMSMGIEI